MLSDVGVRGVSKCSICFFFFFFVVVVVVVFLSRHHTEPNIDILLTRNLHFNSDVRQ